MRNDLEEAFISFLECMGELDIALQEQMAESNDVLREQYRKFISGIESRSSKVRAKLRSFWKDESYDVQHSFNELSELIRGTSMFITIMCITLGDYGEDDDKVLVVIRLGESIRKIKDNLINKIEKGR